MCRGLKAAWLCVRAAQVHVATMSAVVAAPTCCLHPQHWFAPGRLAQEEVQRPGRHVQWHDLPQLIKRHEQQLLQRLLYAAEAGSAEGVEAWEGLQEGRSATGHFSQRLAQRRALGAPGDCLDGCHHCPLHQARAQDFQATNLEALQSFLLAKPLFSWPFPCALLGQQHLVQLFLW